MENKRDSSRLKIPPNITREHIIQAIKDIEITPYPEKNESRKYDLLFEGESYPPKVVLSRANKYANGTLLDVSEFSGGEQFANRFLRERGFEISLKDDPNTDFEYESFSWKKISNTIATKRMDKSSFKHHGTGIPVDLRHFFGIDSIKVGDRKEVTLTHGILNFPAHFEMVNEKNPRTRLLWRADLQLFIQNRFPVWSKYFDTHTKHNASTPILTIVKTSLENNYRVFFEETKRSSDALVPNRVYSREELKEQFNITDATINNGIFKPKDFSSVWLFVTEEKTPDRTQYKDNFDGQVLHFEGQTMGKTDHLISNHEIDGNEIIVFYRKKKNEFPNYGFRYVGRFSYYSHTSSESTLKPTRFILYPIDMLLDDDDKEMVVADSSYLPRMEGKERTRTQTYYERNPKLRNQAIKIHGTKCVICGFDFGKKYGPFGEGYIEIHHVIPHSSIKGEHEIDPQKDLVPVCSNCHRMIHKPRDSWLTVDEIKKLVQ
jgi:5-methylcytosine-specific restriction protein A